MDPRAAQFKPSTAVAAAGADMDWLDNLHKLHDPFPERRSQQRGGGWSRYSFIDICIMSTLKTAAGYGFRYAELVPFTKVLRAKFDRLERNPTGAEVSLIGFFRDVRDERVRLMVPPDDYMQFLAWLQSVGVVCLLDCDTVRDRVREALAQQGVTTNE